MYHCRKTDNNTLRKNINIPFLITFNLPPLFFSVVFVVVQKIVLHPMGGRRTRAALASARIARTHTFFTQRRRILPLI